MIFHLRLQSFVRFVICLFLFFLSFFQKGSVICILLLAVAWILTGGFVSCLRIAFRNRLLLLLIGFYLLHIISLLYSANKDYALFDLQTKLSYLFFPLFFSAFTFTTKDVQRFKNYFVGGALVGVLLCLYYAFGSYRDTHDSAYFFYEHYSHFLHPAYFSIYLNVAVLFLVENIYSEGSSSKYNSAKIILIVFLFVNISLLSSRTALVAAFFSTIVYLPILIFQKRPQRNGIITGIIIIAGAVIVQLSSMQVFNRFEQVAQAINQSADVAPLPVDTIAAEPKGENSTTTHYAIWKNAWGLVGQHPVLGVGIGDVHDELNKVYVLNKFESGQARDFNPHNQFLNTMISIGILGGLILLLVIFYPAFLAWKKQYWIYILFLMVNFMNCMTESILERQAGIIFFAFFFSLFALQLKAGETELH
jgi:O-antigen ligase